MEMEGSSNLSPVVLGPIELQVLVGPHVLGQAGLARHEGVVGEPHAGGGAQTQVLASRRRGHSCAPANIMSSCLDVCEAKLQKSTILTGLPLDLKP